MGNQCRAMGCFGWVLCRVCSNLTLSYLVRLKVEGLYLGLLKFKDEGRGVHQQRYMFLACIMLIR